MNEEGSDVDFLHKASHMNFSCYVRLILISTLNSSILLHPSVPRSPESELQDCQRETQPPKPKVDKIAGQREMRI